MQKCGTKNSCHGCPLKPDDLDYYYGDKTPEILGSVAEELKFVDFPDPDVVASKMMARGVLSVSKQRIANVTKAARMLGTTLCLTK